MKKLIIQLAILLFGVGVMALAWVWFGWKLALVLFLWEFHSRLETTTR